MVLNPLKTVVMTVSRKKNYFNYAYYINNHELKRVEQHKYLGLIFTSDLRWNHHIDYVCAKANKSLWCLRRHLPFATQETKCLAYKTLIRPIIEYAKIVWDPFSVTNISKIEKIQRLAVRFIFNKYRWTDSPSQLCALAELPTIQARTKYERLKYLYLILNHHVHIRYADYFDILRSETSRHRHSMFIRAPAIFTDCYKYSFFPRAINDWNSLTEEAVSCSSVDLFLKHIAHILTCS